MHRIWRRLRVAMVLATVTLLFAAAVPAHSQGLSGSIKTGKGDCSTVNGNQYDTKGDVYLLGGSQNGNLPAGDYYFQVTDPSGGSVLSQDAVTDRMFTLDANGGITAYTGTHSVTTCPGGNLAVQLLPFATTTNSGGVYKLWVSNSSDFTTGPTKVDAFMVRGDVPVDAQAQVTVVKFYDPSTAAVSTTVYDGTQTTIDGWNMTLIEPVSNWTITEATSGGQVIFTNLAATSAYTVTELPMPGTGIAGAYWVASTPDTVTFTAGTAETVAFGNRCFAPGSVNGRTLGFWSNKNGQGLITAGAIDALNGLPLFFNAWFTAADGFGSTSSAQQLSTARANLRSYLLNATATDMRYMLSAQLVATKLAILAGSPALDPDTVIYAPNFGTTTIGAIVALAEAELAAATTRGYQEQLKDVLDDINNNRVPIIQAAGVCQVEYPTP